MSYAEHNRPTKSARLWSDITIGLFTLGMTFTATAGDAARGKELAQRWCSDCHAVSDADTGTDAAPAFSTLAVDPQKSPQALRAWLLNPHEPMVELELSRVDVDDLIAYIQSLDGAVSDAR